jgi:hypothetical protein
MSSWLLLRIPRTAGATSLSGVLGAGDFVATATGADIPSVCDALLARAKDAGRDVGAPTVVFPLDGRHGLAHVVLEEANRRGWSFSRHVPRGAEAHLLDLDGADAAPELTDAAPRFEAVTQEVRDAIEGSELGEALSALRHLLVLGVRHHGPWHPDTLWAVSNLVRIAAGTGADANIDQACALAEHLVAQPLPDALDNPNGTMRKLEETARNCAQAGRTDTAVRLMDAAVSLAAKVYGEGHVNHLAVQNNTCQLLAAIASPRAEPAMRELLRTARAGLGERHPNIAVVLSNLADLLEAQGRAEEAAPLRAEAAALRS